MIDTDRLILRGWRASDVPAHNAMCNDPVFMANLGPLLPMAESAAAAARQIDHEARYGSCFWAIEHRPSGVFIGYCGIKPGPERTPIATLPEIGWGIAPTHWRQGYAREAATACLDWAWTSRDWPSVFAITTPGNVASWRLMERLGMRRLVNRDFNHPALGQDDPLRPHITYRIDKP